MHAKSLTWVLRGFRELELSFSSLQGKLSTHWAHPLHQFHSPAQRLCMCGYLHVRRRAGDQKGASALLALELQAAVSYPTMVLGAELGSFGRTDHVLQCWAISPILPLPFMSPL